MTNPSYKRGWFTAALLATAAGAAIAGNGHESVSSDGTVIESAVSGTTRGVSSFAGRRTPGVPLDAEAEFAARRDSDDEMAEMARNYRSIVPRYARNQAVPESVIGIDRRFRVYPAESGDPHRVIGLLTFTQSGSGLICTGWLINANTVATAGHCVHEGIGGVFSTDVTFYPGRDGASSPFGSCTARTLFTVPQWSDSGNAKFDYGAVKLNCTIGNTTGWFGFFAQTASLVGLPVLISGYPGDKPFGTHWTGSGDVLVSGPRKTRYQIDTFGGQSGAPVFETDRTGALCTGSCANSIHAYGVVNGTNSATRITQEIFDNLNAWRNAP